MGLFNQEGFAQLRNKLNELDDNLFTIFGLVNLGETDLSECNKHLDFANKQIQSILGDFEKTQFPYIGN